MRHKGERIKNVFRSNPKQSNLVNRDAIYGNGKGWMRNWLGVK